MGRLWQEPVSWGLSSGRLASSCREVATDALRDGDYDFACSHQLTGLPPMATFEFGLEPEPSERRRVASIGQVDGFRELMASLAKDLSFPGWHGWKRRFENVPGRVA